MNLNWQGFRYALGASLLVTLGYALWWAFVAFVFVVWVGFPLIIVGPICFILFTNRVSAALGRLDVSSGPQGQYVYPPAERTDDEDRAVKARAFGGGAR